jgi:hypothetical protein
MRHRWTTSLKILGLATLALITATLVSLAFLHVS